MERRVPTLTEPSLPSKRMLKKHFLLFPDIIPGQIKITPTEKPKINIGIIWKKFLWNVFIKLFLIDSFPSHYAIRDGVISVAIKELEYLYYKGMETSIIVISPSCIYCKRTYNKCHILQPMCAWLINTIFVKIWFAHIYILSKLMLLKF